MMEPTPERAEEMKQLDALERAEGPASTACLACSENIKEQSGQRGAWKHLTMMPGRWSVGPRPSRLLHRGDKGLLLCTML